MKPELKQITIPFKAGELTITGDIPFLDEMVARLWRGGIIKHSPGGDYKAVEYDEH